MTPTSSDGKAFLQSARGFTLLEMLAAVALLAMTAGVIIPSFHHIAKRIRQENAVSVLAADLRRLRNDAERRNSSVYVSFTAEGYASATGAIRREWPTGVRAHVSNVDDNTIVLSNTPASEPIEITIEYGAARSRIIVEPVTGRIKQY